LETYDTYSSEEQRGTLLFIIMMNNRLSDTEAAVSNLQTTLEKMKVTDYEGENVSRAVSLILGAHKRLVAVNKVPDDLSNQIVEVLQTS